MTTVTERAPVTPPGVRSDSRGPLLLVLLLSSLPYLASVGFDFVYDDVGQLVENTFLKNPEHAGNVVRLETLRQADVINGRRPLVLATYFADLAVWDLRPAGFHLSNLLMHLATVLLLHAFARRFFEITGSGRPSTALALAMLFGIHPALFETVHMPAFRPDMLYTFFVLAGLRIALGLVEQYSWRWLVRVVGFGGAGFLALCSKEAGVVLPLLLGIMWFLFPALRPRRGTMQVLMGISLLVILLFSALCVGGAPLQAAAVSWNGVSYPFPANIVTSPWLVAHYVSLLLIPWPLVVDHIVPPVAALADFRWLVGLVVTGSLLGVIGSHRARRPHLAWGAAWCVAIFLPVSNLVPLMNPFAERYMYGMVVGLAWVVATLLETLSFSRRRAVMVVISIAWLGVSFIRLPEWKNNASLWEATLTKEPRSTRAMVYTALEKKRAGELEEAKALLEKAMEVNPHDTSSSINLAIIYGQAGDLLEAERLLREAIRLQPRRSEAYANLAFDLELQDKKGEARTVLEEGLAINRFNLRVRSMLTDRYIEEGRFQEAHDLAEETLALDPENEAAVKARKYTRWQLGGNQAK